MVQEFLKRHGSRTVTYWQLEPTVDVIERLARTQKDRGGQPRGQREDLEPRPVVEYCGTHIEGAQYSELP
jgi:hypothetical protein